MCKGKVESFEEMANNTVIKQGKDNMRKKLAAAVKSIQWSYAIYWTTTSKEPGVDRVLQWGEGYYNGDIKTRRTIQSMDLIKGEDQIGSQRCDQLRELYESLLSTNTNKQARRPWAALSPEDLTNVEWFYLVCMSFVYKSGQGLAGTSFADGRTIWLRNADCADTSVFWRSLLAKSAGIKTVVCFPYQKGVIELGVTDLVQEDFKLIQHVKTVFLDNSSSLPPQILQGDQEESPSGSSSEAEEILRSTNVIMLDEVPQAQSWYLLDDRQSNYVNTSMTISDCISQSAMVHDEYVAPSPKIEIMIDNSLQNNDVREWNDQVMVVSGLDNTSMSQDLHFKNVSSLFKTSNHEILGLSSHGKLDKTSSFIRWIKDGKQSGSFGDKITNSPQTMLKKILFEVPLMHRAHSSLEPKEDNVMVNNELGKQHEADNVVSTTNHVLAERRRREKFNERLSTLRSLIPPTTKIDKVSILDETIEYLKELETRVEELESCQELASYYAMKKKRKAVDIEERTSDNYGNDINVGALASIGHVRATREDNNPSDNNTLLVRLVEKEIVIELRCRWRESLLLEIMDTMSSLRLNSQSVQSSTVDGTLSLTIHTTRQFEGSASGSIGTITEALQRLIRNC